MRDFLIKIMLNIYQVLFAILGFLLPKNKKIIIFESFLGKQYSDNPRAIYEYIKEHDPNYIMYWSVDREHLTYFKEKNIRYVQRFTLKWLFLMTTAKYWVTNSRLPLWIPKPRNTIYIQTWHGTPLKRLAADMDEVHMAGTNTKQYKREFLQEAKKWDYLISPNSYSTHIFKRAFQFEGIVIESGYPRNDYLINADSSVATSLKRSLNLPLDKKVILYAPTWRDNQYHSKGNYKFTLEMDLKRMKKELGKDYVVLLRLHYLVAEGLNLSEYSDFVFDYSHHQDIRELYLVSDLLITDYSSVFFDYGNLRRPMLFFTYDMEDYRDNIRGFYFDFELKAPGPLVKTTRELINEIKLIDYNEYHLTKETLDFYNEFCYLDDGNASERVVKEIFKIK